jgi:hypothetical protein
MSRQQINLTKKPKIASLGMIEKIIAALKGDPS